MQMRVYQLISQFPVSQHRLETLRSATSYDNVLQPLAGFIIKGWSSHKANLSLIGKPYWDMEKAKLEPVKSPSGGEFGEQGGVPDCMEGMRYVKGDSSDFLFGIEDHHPLCGFPVRPVDLFQWVTMETKLHIERFVKYRVHKAEVPRWLPWQHNSANHRRDPISDIFTNYIVLRRLTLHNLEKKDMGRVSNSCFEFPIASRHFCLNLAVSPPSEHAEYLVELWAKEHAAVVGAGIGGSAAAYFARQEFGPDIALDVFEAGTVGGRLATIDVNGKAYEAGGSVIHPLNLHMVEIAKSLGLKQQKISEKKFAIFDGTDFVFVESDWYIINILRILWRYGFSYLRMQLWVEDVVDRFMSSHGLWTSGRHAKYGNEQCIYKCQSRGYSFSSNEKLLFAIGQEDFLKLLKQPLDEVLLQQGVSRHFIDEVVAPVIRTNYGQGTNISAFVGAVALAGAQSGLWSVEGGNKLMCFSLMYAAKARLLTARVTSIAFKKRPRKKGSEANVYEVIYETASGQSRDVYDMVFVCTPLHTDHPPISFSGVEPFVGHFPGSYQQIFATFVHGTVNASYFNYETKFPISAVFTTSTDLVFFNSIGMLTPVNISGMSQQDPSEMVVWKVFSPHALTKVELHTLFSSYHSKQDIDWLAYPHYNPSRKQLPPIRLHHGLYYLNGLEWIVSCMETAVVAAKNAVMLADANWYGHTEHVDQNDLLQRIKTEL
uniref:prenylcysteine oxidase-like n=1 Tax=Myxine glutinosa TaxID=7769 RepID=UPI00358FF787